MGLVAAVHYFYMREYWVIFQESPIVYRYIDWSITVPLQMVEFYLVLHAVDKSISGGMFWRLLLGTVAMLCFGYLGETSVLNAWLRLGKPPSKLIPPTSTSSPLSTHAVSLCLAAG